MRVGGPWARSSRRGPWSIQARIQTTAFRMSDSSRGAFEARSASGGAGDPTWTYLSDVNVLFSHPSELYPQKDGRKVRSRDEGTLKFRRVAGGRPDAASAADFRRLSEPPRSPGGTFSPPGSATSTRDHSSRRRKGPSWVGVCRGASALWYWWRGPSSTVRADVAGPRRSMTPGRVLLCGELSSGACRPNRRRTAVSCCAGAESVRRVLGGGHS